MRLTAMILVSTMVLLVPSLTLATTWSVPSPECPTIQAGIDSAAAGDTVLVACGTYTWTGEGTGESGTLIRMKSGVWLRSETGLPDCVTIDAENQGRILYCGYKSDSVIEGFTFAGGTKSAGGGAIYCSYSSLTVLHCVFSGNSAADGGGMYCQSSSLTVTY